MKTSGVLFAARKIEERKIILWLHWMPAGPHGAGHGPEVASEPGSRSYQDGETRAFAALRRQSSASLSATWLNSR